MTATQGRIFGIAVIYQSLPCVDVASQQMPIAWVSAFWETITDWLYYKVDPIHKFEESTSFYCLQKTKVGRLLIQRDGQNRKKGVSLRNLDQ